MASLLIKDLPKPLHKKLKELAAAHHRSMNREIISILEAAATRPRVGKLPPPLKPNFPLTQAFIDKAKSEGRL
jgi:Arc-like DNA binding domain